VPLLSSGHGQKAVAKNVLQMVKESLQVEIILLAYAIPERYGML